MIEEKKYHHGNLKVALIEAGIEMVNEVGEEHLSLRKVAARCGVSNAAPYAHFTDKEDMLNAMREYVTDAFMKCLTRASGQGSGEEKVLMVGREYVLFFHRNPHYFPFLFSQPCMKINLSLEHAPDNFPPYELFKSMVLEFNESSGVKPDKLSLEIEIIQLWAYVHGLTAISVMKNVTWDEDWEQQILRLLVMRPPENAEL
ncbi:MAG: TetR/AcrR family transcriptional regulator [bacterium]|nr:TetR/AcrR family transcriptional regulator [bacterium]